MAQIIVPDNELNSFDLPPVCVVTGATQGVVWKKVKFAWYPRWVTVLILVNVLVMAIVAAILTKRVKGELPFTEEAYSAWRRGRIFFGLAITAAIGLLIGGAVALATDSPAVGVALLLLTFAVPIAVWFAFVKGKTVTCTRIADGSTSLNIPSEAAATQIRTHLTGGASRRPALASRMPA